MYLECLFINLIITVFIYKLCKIYNTKIFSKPDYIINIKTRLYRNNFLSLTFFIVKLYLMQFLYRTAHDYMSGGILFIISMINSDIFRKSLACTVKFYQSSLKFTLDSTAFSVDINCGR